MAIARIMQESRLLIPYGWVCNLCKINNKTSRKIIFINRQEVVIRVNEKKYTVNDKKVVEMHIRKHKKKKERGKKTGAI